MRPAKRPIRSLAAWVRRQPPKVKAFLGIITGMTTLFTLRAIVNDHDNLFVAAEAVHSVGISVLIYKLMKEKTCAGIIFIFSIVELNVVVLFYATMMLVYCSNAERYKNVSFLWIM